jgi:hypothetical protein
LDLHIRKDLSLVGAYAFAVVAACTQLISPALEDRPSVND